MKKLLACLLSASFLLAMSCSDDDKKDTTPTPTDENPTTTAEVLALYESVFYGADDIYIDPNDDDYIIVEASCFPDHKSPYFEGTEWEADMWIDDTRSSFMQAPGNVVSVVNYTFRLPVNPSEDASKTALPTATIGVAINGVPLFNQYAAGNSPITTSSGEYLSFDLYGGHPTPNDEYHYHIEPNYITSAKGKDALIGFLLDGFPVYGPLEDGKTLVSADLDAYHGHEHETEEYPAGIYHYHITADSPYINGNGYFGNAGSWSK
jgi:hypothetical protein